jgi:hypothetical protein
MKHSHIYGAGPSIDEASGAFRYVILVVLTLEMMGNKEKEV